MTKRYELQHLLLGLLILLCLFSLGTQISESYQVPRDDDFLLAKKKLIEMNYEKESDALAILPAWSLRPLQTLGDLDPIGSDFLHLLPQLPYKRLFVLQEADADSPMKQVMKTYGEPVDSWSLGRIQLHHFASNNSSLGTFAENIQKALVTTRKKDSVSDCVWRKSSHQCGTGSKPIYVKSKWMRTTQNGTQLISVTPPRNNEKLTITFPKQKRQPYLIFYGGHTRSTLKKQPKKVSIDIMLNNQKIKTIQWGAQFPMELVSIKVPEFENQLHELSIVFEGSRRNKNTFGINGFWAEMPARQATP